MKFLKTINRIVGILSIFSFIFPGCTKWQTTHSGTYNGQSYLFQSRSVKGYSTNRNEWRIKLGKFKPIYLDAVNMDWGPPYSTDIYGDKTYIIRNDTIRYRSDNFNPNDDFVFSSMIYIPFNSPDDVAGLAYFDLLQNNWPVFDSIFRDAHQYGLPIILGYVKGAKEDFTLLFKGIVNEKPMKLRIENDGRIAFENDDKWSQPVYSGLSTLVQMPDKKIIILNTTDGLTLDDIKRMKNQQGKDPTQYFDFQQAQ